MTDQDLIGLWAVSGTRHLGRIDEVRYDHRGPLFVGRRLDGAPWESRTPAPLTEEYKEIFNTMQEREDGR